MRRNGQAVLLSDRLLPPKPSNHTGIVRSKMMVCKVRLWLGITGVPTPYVIKKQYQFKCQKSNNVKLQPYHHNSPRHLSSSSFACIIDGCLVEVLFSDTAFSRRNKRVKLSEERNRPHKVAAHDGQNSRGSPESVRRKGQLCCRKRPAMNRIDGMGRPTLGFRPWEPGTMMPHTGRR
jgi:hypothetical protein